MTVSLIRVTENAERLIEEAGRTCYQSFDKADDTSHERLIKVLIKSGHDSVLEHAAATFVISGVSRALTHQLVRHRIASYSQKSQRYCKEGQFEYVIPDKLKELGGNTLDLYNKLMAEIQCTYDSLMQAGLKAEDARFVLPNACTTEIVVTMNFRALRHFFHERLAPTAQWEIRQVASEMYDLLTAVAPTVFSLSDKLKLSGKEESL
jgi:thymidylate synthase (FAD)